MIRELSSKDFTVSNGKAKVNGMTRPGLLFIHADWCPHCIRFKPDFNELDKKIGHGFTLLAIEDKKIGNSDLMNALGIQGYPTLKWVDAEGNITGEYTGERKISTIMNHICEHFHFCVGK